MKICCKKELIAPKQLESNINVREAWAKKILVKNNNLNLQFYFAEVPNGMIL